MNTNFCVVKNYNAFLLSYISICSHWVNVVFLLAGVLFFCKILHVNASHFTKIQFGQYDENEFFFVKKYLPIYLEFWHSTICSRKKQIYVTWWSCRLFFTLTLMCTVMSMAVQTLLQVIKPFNPHRQSSVAFSAVHWGFSQKTKIYNLLEDNSLLQPPSINHNLGLL